MAAHPIHRARPLVVRQPETEGRGGGSVRRMRRGTAASLQGSVHSNQVDGLLVARGRHRLDPALGRFEFAYPCAVPGYNRRMLRALRAASWGHFTSRR